VQTDETGLTEPPQPASVAQPRTAGLPGPSPDRAAGIARGAALVAGLGALSRSLGLVRTLVFSQSVGAGCMGTAYVTANQVPNLIYELVLGGALTSAMVPILARSAERAATDSEARDHVARISSALLTWAVVILVPLTAIIAALAGPIASLLIPANPNAACDHADMVRVTGTMVTVFAPQILLYGLSVVLFGLLTAYRRFTGPALAPVIANFVMIGSYLAFASLDKNLPLARTPLAAELVLSLGATLNIGTLVVVALPPTWRLHLRLRPALRFPPGVMRQAGGLAMVGVLEFLAGDLAGVVTIALANGRGDTAALVLVNYASLVSSAVISVLALSIVTSAFPVLSAADGDAFDQTCAGSMRAVILASGLGAAVMAAVCVPAAHILARQPDQVGQMIQGLALMAPGVAGMGVIVNASRVMFVVGRLKLAAALLVAPPLLQMAASAALVSLVPPRLVVAALSLATSISTLVPAAPAVFATRRIRGAAAVAGIGHATIAGLAAAAAAAAAGVAVTLALPVGRKLFDAGSGAVATAAALAAFGAVAYVLDRDDLRAAIQPLRRFPGLRRPRRRRYQG
jgi:putative peptidoglycan lipid II flippase